MLIPTAGVFLSFIAKDFAMRMHVLVDNNTLIDRYFKGEPGLSVLLEEDEAVFLFDVGYSGLFLENARKMGLAPLDADALILSHGHLDHTWGLSEWIRGATDRWIESKFALQTPKPRLLAHPNALASKSVQDLPEIGAFIGLEKLERFFAVDLSAAPRQLSKNLYYLGEIPRVHDFDHAAHKAVAHLDGVEAPDALLDDTALAYTSDAGLVVVTGCAHAGVCNTIAHARDVTGESRVRAVIGGFHLQNTAPGRLARIGEFLAELELEALYPCHCTDLSAKIALAAHAPVKEVGVGLVLDYEGKH